MYSKVHARGPDNAHVLLVIQEAEEDTDIVLPDIIINYINSISSEQLQVTADSI